MNKTHYKFINDGWVQPLCSLGYYPNHIVTKDISKITCTFCVTILMVEEEVKFYEAPPILQ